jgi:hypothetical protein
MKATDERRDDGLSVEDVCEAILNARSITKTLRSISPTRANRGERLYVIEGATYDGLWIYTKGTIRRSGDRQVFYVLISAKLSE